MVPPASDGVSRVPRYSGSCLPHSAFAYGAFTLSGWLSQSHSPALRSAFLRSEPRGAAHPGLGPSHFARRYSRNRCFFLFLRLLRCFSSPGSPPCVMCWRMDTWYAPCRFPHSDISGSMGICPSPRLFAAYHVFHRLLVPRHPPCALIRLTFRQSFCSLSLGTLFPVSSTVFRSRGTLFLFPEQFFLFFPLFPRLA